MGSSKRNTVLWMQDTNERRRWSNGGSSNDWTTPKHQRLRRMVTTIYSMKYYLLLREHFLFLDYQVLTLHCHQHHKITEKQLLLLLLLLLLLSVIFTREKKTHMHTHNGWKEMDSSEKGELCVRFYGFRLYILFLLSSLFCVSLSEEREVEISAQLNKNWSALNNSRASNGCVTISIDMLLTVFFFAGPLKCAQQCTGCATVYL